MESKGAGDGEELGQWEGPASQGRCPQMVHILYLLLRCADGTRVGAKQHSVRPGGSNFRPPTCGPQLRPGGMGRELPGSALPPHPGNTGTTQGHPHLRHPHKCQLLGASGVEAVFMEMPTEQLATWGVTIPSSLPH